MATKLKNRLSIYRLEKEMVIEAVCAIRNGVNPKMLKEQLSSYLILSSKSQKR
jgi:flagellar motor component MotA